MKKRIINPNAPDEYKYETDYRKVPREYLNQDIPTGRGKIKWQPNGNNSRTIRKN